MNNPSWSLLLGLVLVVALAACDTGISGTAFENEAPNTVLSVRDSSLVDNLAGAERLSSTVFVSWSGTDPDGYVTAFEIRFYASSAAPGPEDGWSTTTDTDSLVLLPIPPGERAADVTFEVRSIDNDGVKDPSPARTVFPIQNAPPEIQLSAFDLPPDTTFTVFSFGWNASDPEGDENLSRIEVSFNDSTQFVDLPIDAEFVTFVGENIDRANPGQTTADVRVFLGRAFQSTEIRVPNLQLNAENTFYVRAVDQTDTTSTLGAYAWYVRKPEGRVLYVNDYRKASNPTLQRFHLDLLNAYLPEGTGVDTWYIAEPFVTGNAGSVPRSDALPPAAAPTLRQTLTQWDYIYWVTTASTNNIQGNNLPFVAGALDLFFEQGGKLMVHSPISLPDDPEANLNNPAVAALPLTDLIVFPDSLRRLSLADGARIDPAEPVPGLGISLPALAADGFIIGSLPYLTTGANDIALYNAQFEYRTRTNQQGDWTGASTVASMSADQRIGLFSLPLVNEQTGVPVLIGADGDPNAPRQAIFLMLEGLGFPKR